MALSGTCKSWRADKGFGFISADDGSEVFMHVMACTDGGVPQQGDTLTFDVEDSEKKPGQVQAKNVSGGTGKPGEKGAGKGGGPPGANSGQVKSFNAEKGFGFVVGPDGADVFCHLHAVVDGTVPQTGDTISFDIEPSKSKPGQFTACNVQGGTGYAPKGGKGGGKDDGWGKGGYGAAKGDGWGGGGGPYGGGKGMDKGWGKPMDKGWGKGMDKGWGADPWAGGGGKGWGGDDGWGGGGGKGGYDAWGGKDAWGGDGGKGKGWGGDGGKGKGWGDDAGKGWGGGAAKGYGGAKGGW